MQDAPRPDVSAFLDAVTPDARRTDAVALDRIFRAASGFAPRIWTPGILGYGTYDYTYDSGRSGRWFATGFAPRKAGTVVHILPGYADFTDILGDLGPHRKGRACVYLPRLHKIDTDALHRLIRAGLADLATHWPVQPT